MVKNKEKIELKLVTIKRWSGVSAAARRLGVTPTQVSRHLSSKPGDVGYSRKLAARMDELGILVRR